MTNNNNAINESVTTRLVVQNVNTANNNNSNQPNQLLKSKSQVPLNGSEVQYQDSDYNKNQFILNNCHFFMNEDSSDNHNYQNVTIWREELNAKNNVQQQIRKQTELCQKIEDSKKHIPEWKKNLLKQKELKKFTSTSGTQRFITNSNCVPETPELMKHNMFIKKGLASNM
jgi:hypothetical protein